MIDVKRCSNCLEENTYCKESKDGYYVLCPVCGVQGPVEKSAKDAVRVWDGLSRGPSDVTTATLVRMLDETRTFHEELQEQYFTLKSERSDLQNRYNIKKSNELCHAYGGTPAPGTAGPLHDSQDYYIEHEGSPEQCLLDALGKGAHLSTSGLAKKLGWKISFTGRLCLELCSLGKLYNTNVGLGPQDPQWYLVTDKNRDPKTTAEHVSKMAMDEIANTISVGDLKDIQLMGKNVVPNLEKEISCLKRELLHEKCLNKTLQTDQERMSKDLKNALERFHKLDDSIKRP